MSAYEQWRVGIEQRISWLEGCVSRLEACMQQELRSPELVLFEQLRGIAQELYENYAADNGWDIPGKAYSLSPEQAKDAVPLHVSVRKLAVVLAELERFDRDAALRATREEVCR